MRRLEDHHKVLGVGLSKTGTTSLSAALNTLGVRTTHNPHDGRLLQELESGDFRLSILKRYQGVADIPVAPYFAQLDELYPNSKFILTVRDEDSWIASSRKHWQQMPSWEGDPLYRFLHAVVYGCLEFNEERFRFAYRTHCGNVMDHFANRPDDFLRMDIIDGDGWEALCPFLGLDIPAEPFPHHNTAADTEAWASRLRRTVNEIETIIPEGEPFILVDEQEFGRLLIRGRRPIPFLERDGEYWGRPPDGVTAVRDLERLRETGARFIAFAWPAFWWLEHYEALQSHLHRRCPCVLRNRRVIVFRLAAGEPPFSPAKALARGSQFD